MIPIDHLSVSAFVIPTSTPESDGTLEWDRTTLVLVEASAGHVKGLGYAFADLATAKLIHDSLTPAVVGRDAFGVAGAYLAMWRQVRNLGRPGIASMAISAVDTALWDLKARILGIPLAALLGPAQEAIEAYGSGGFTSYSIHQLQQQLGGWVEDGLRKVKMKIGRHAKADLERVRAAREAIGAGTELFVDANGAYGRKEALAQARELSLQGVSWFEEPVSSDDLEGLRLLRDLGPPGMRIAAGEYGYDIFYFRRMLDAGAVDVMQADATRCGGFTGFLQVDALCQSHCLKLSAHTAPSLHAHVCCAATTAESIEYFFDHARIEQLLFDGALKPEGGVLSPDLSRPGLGLEEPKRKDAERYAA